jgi:Domain of unknown function (DUF397)
VDAQDLRRAEWRTSSYSGGNGSCVEIATNLPGIIAVRDSKNRQGWTATVSSYQWSLFLQAISQGQFDL